ncbi:Down syndrome cell adhesion molecule-like protein Dscam2 isoform X2 [Cimex lectularius]|uniref:Down syndrome cell adhesion molecule-like protein Dscam2 n=1 Tax=Cimex lectularius TaxID=79782 RepID=A0A8I6RJH9_CIMLE|nr:Down syndrome cell adhesion molecule-like protein Dscam2 isoform X2 [Cimex lectularius]
MWLPSALLFGLFAFGWCDDTTVGPMFIKEPPNRVDFSNTTGTVIECSARGNPTPDIIWIRSDGTAVGDVPGLRQVLGNGNLVFPPFRAEDYRQEVHAQVYICLAKNSVGSIHSRDVNVRAVVDQLYDTRVIDEYVLRGNAAVLKCLIPSFVADFVQVLDWRTDDGTSLVSPVSRDSKGYDGKYLVLPSGELHIKDVGPEDGHKSYQCRTKHRLTGETRLSATKGRLVITDPIGSKSPTVGGGDDLTGISITKKKGLSFSLFCIAQGHPLPKWTWYKFVEGTSRKQAVVMSDRIKQVSGTLIIREAKVEDSGKYLCVVNNSVGGESVETVLTVTAPLVAGVEPSVQTVDFGRPALLTCNYEGNPVKTISWLKDGKILQGHNGPVLKIESVRKEDKGMYQCFVRNEQESAQSSAELKLGSRFEPPLITEGFASKTLEAGPSVYFKCVGKGNPIPEISWYLDGKKLTSADRIQVGQHITSNTNVVSYLNITSVHTNDGGLYKCVASSIVGTVEHAERLNVYGLPFVRPMEKKAIVAGETLIVTCPVAGFPIEQIQWERDGRVLPINRKQKVFANGTLIIENVERLSDQATYTCVAKNSQGYSSRGTLEVQVMVSPKVASFTFGEIPYEAEQFVSVMCSVLQGDLPIRITWELNKQPLFSNNEIVIVQTSKRTSALSIESVSEKHVGNYSCIGMNEAGYDVHTASLLVNVPPRWIIEPTDKAFAQGSDAKVECKADGFPKPSVTWKRASGDSPGDYKDLKPNNPDVKVDDGTLYIHNIQKTNEGYYLCEAVNGIGSGLSAVIMISVQAPPQFETKMKNQTARIDESTVLQCEAKGEKPIGILWNMNNKRLDPKSDIRYTIREEILPHGVVSDLSIRTTGREDSALFTCVATNSFGSDDTSINLIVQEIPEAPHALKVLDKSGRTVQLAWAAPYDGNSPITRYVIEYKVSKGTWDADVVRVDVPGQQTTSGVFSLNPATTYHMRVVAENEVGTSEHSEPVTIITAEEAPSGSPTNIKVEAVDQVTLKVTWSPPERDSWNGEIQGYYVGYKLSDSDKPYLFETVEFSKEEGKQHHLMISNLKTYTQYSVVVQAFNKLGAGPMSEETKQYTAEGIPDEPPHEVTCTTLTSQTIRISWVSPAPETANGIIKGYKVIYGPSDTWYDEKSKDSKITASSETIIHGLKKYTNYSMQVLAFTSGGDGVKSTPIHCQTEQDVPDSPTAVKALAMSDESILISWKPPSQPNGIISQYTVYFKEDPDSGNAVPKSQKMPAFQMTYEASGLNKDGKYEFWVTASTNIGEGQPSKSVILSPSVKVPARIASFDGKFTATYKEDVKLPCLAVGKPTPDIKWKVKGISFETNDRMQQLPEGSLLIKSVTRADAGEYSCTVENNFGQDSVTHHLIILAPPHMPQVTLQSTTTNSITMKIKPNAADTEPIHGYTVKYKPEFGDWETMQLLPTIHKFTLENLWCGSRYMVSVTAYNSIGTGDESDILNTRTKGSKPIIPEASRFIEVSTNSITLHLSTWSDGGCPMLYFVVEHKKKMSTEWNQVSNNVKPGGNFVVLDLDPASWYNLRVTAHNNAGFAVAEYEFATLTITGGTVSPPKRGVQDVHHYFPWIPKWIDLNVVVPAGATIIVIFVGIIVICVALARRSRGPPSTRLRDDIVYNQSMVGGNTIDKRCPDLHDELGYIPPPNRKLPPVPGSNYNTCERIKRGTGIRRAGLCSGHSTWDPRRHMYEELASHTPCRGRLPRCPGSDETMYHRAGMDDDICPYATFHLLGFREEMDPSKAMQFQTFPHQNGHCGTLGPGGVGTNVHHRSGSQSMPRNGRYSRVGPNSTFSPEYDDPANCTEDDPYGSQYTPYGAPYDHYSSRNSLGRRSVGSARNLTLAGSPEPPPPPPRNHDANSSANDSKESNEMSEAECDRDMANRNYQVSTRNNSKDGMTTEEMRKLIERNTNEGGPQQFQNGGLTAYDTVAV